MDKLNRIRLMAGLCIDPKSLIESRDGMGDIEIPVNIAKSAVPAGAVGAPNVGQLVAATVEVDGEEKEIAGDDEVSGDPESDEDCCTYEVGQAVTHNGEPMVVAVANADGDHVGIVPVGSEDDISAIVIVSADELEAGDAPAGEGEAGGEDEIASAEADAAKVLDDLGGGVSAEAGDIEADDEQNGMSNIPESENEDALRNQMDEIHRNMEAAGRGVYRIKGKASTGATLTELKKQKLAVASKLEAINAGKKKVDEKVNYYYDTVDQDEDLDVVNNAADGEANKNTVWKEVTMKKDKNEVANQLDHLGAASDGEQVKKVRVPAAVKTALKDAIKEVEEQFVRLGATDIDSRFFYKSLATALATLLQHIEIGTVEEIKKAQIFFSALMSPIMHKVPAVVSNFIIKGGSTPSLKDFMKPVDLKYPITGPRNNLK
jgi:hypothetical protein